VGAKAFNLWRLQRWGFSIPQTVFVPMEVYSAYLVSNRLTQIEKEFIKAVEHSSALPQILRIAQKLRRGILTGAFPEKIEREVVKCAATFTFPLALRSSSLHEDSGRHSFAGQYLTVLDVAPAPKEIGTALKQVWASQWDETVIRYLLERKIRFDKSGMGVIIQQMLTPRYSGVLFSKDPAAGTDRLLIEYVEGLNEALVSAEKTPLQLFFDRKDKKFSPKENRSAFAENLVTQSLRLEKKTQQPVDVEWAVVNSRLYFLQFRPITTSIKTILWTDENVGEVIPDIVTPYSWSILKPITNRAFADFLRRLGLRNYPPEGLFGLYKGKVYFNSTAFNELINTFYISGRFRLGQIPQLFVFIMRALWLNRRLPRKITMHLMRCEKEHSAQKTVSEYGLSEIGRQIRTLIKRHKQTMSLHIACTVFAELYYQFLDKLCLRWLGDPAGMRADLLLTGLNEARSALSGRALLKIAASIKKRKLQQIFLEEDYPQIETLLEQNPEGRDLLQQIQQFIREFGHGSSHEFELFYPRWWEDKQYIYSNLKNYLKEEGPLQWAEKQEKTTRLRKENLLKAQQALPFIKRRFLKHILRKAAFFGTQRENLKQAFVKRHSILKKYLLRLGATAQKQNILDRPLDILFFTEKEIDAWTSNNGQPPLASTLVIRRKEERQKNLTARHPKRMRQLGSQWFPEAQETAQTSRTLKGIGCSPGVVQGPVRILHSAEEAHLLQKGDILVTRSTNPGWTPLFILAAAVVTEIGGALSHGAIIAREYGLPMVAALAGATKKLKDGQTVRVDGTGGEVKILNDTD